MRETYKILEEIGKNYLELEMLEGNLKQAIEEPENLDRYDKKKRIRSLNKKIKSLNAAMLSCKEEYKEAKEADLIYSMMR